MDKTQALKLVVDAAQIYAEELCDKSLLLIFGDEHHPHSIQIVASASNFLHLTGVSLIRNTPDNTPEQFYQKAISQKLSTNDFAIKDGNTKRKLQVLSQTLSLSINAKMIGDYSGSHLRIETGKITGSTSSCLGLCQVNDYYVPQTVLCEDTRNNILKSYRVLAILQKEHSEQCYSQILRVAKKIDLAALLQRVSFAHSISPTLFSSSSHNSQQQPALSTEPLPAVPVQPKYLSRTKRKELKRNAQQATKQPQTPTPDKKHGIGGDALE